METIQKTKNILIPFVGFYESVAGDRVENTAFHNFIYENDIKENPKTGWLDKPEDMMEAEQDKFWDYYEENINDLRREVAEAYIGALAGELGIDIKFESIDSPKYYNYTTDRLFVDVPEADLMRLYNETNKEILAETIKERHTSRPGFDSYYENDINDPSWQDPAMFDHNQWQTVIEAKAKQDGVDLDELYWI